MVNKSIIIIIVKCKGVFFFVKSRACGQVGRAGETEGRRARRWK